jgi:hypothetical protein
MLRSLACRRYLTLDLGSDYEGTACSPGHREAAWPAPLLSGRARRVSGGQIDPVGVRFERDRAPPYRSKRIPSMPTYSRPSRWTGIRRCA